MSKTSTFRLTFHVSHPTISASKIEENFDFPIRFSQSVGGQKKTKNGKVLSGNYKFTNVSFCLHESPLSFDDVSVDALIKNQLEIYDTKYTAHLVESGGSCNFLLGIFSSDNIMFELNHEVICMLSTAKINMKYDFYGGQ